jgi:hypothetical protein
VTDSISPADRALIEHTRKVNKTLSLFVFALQERSNMTSESHLGIAEMLVTLANAIRMRGVNPGPAHAALGLPTPYPLPEEFRPES